MPKAFFRPAVTCDVIVLTILAGRLQVLLVRRGRPPFRGRWAIPGGFVEQDEPLDRAARRELEEETGLRGVRLEQLHTFGDPGRDPRGHTVTIVHLAFVHPRRLAGRTGKRIRAGDDAAALRWFPAHRLPPLAFDHADVMALALERIRDRLYTTSIGSDLLARAFTLDDLKRVYERILNRRLDPGAFRRRILRTGILKPVKGPRRKSRPSASRFAFHTPG